MESEEYKICSKCIMSTTDPDIWFDDKMICSNCKAYDEKISKRVFTGKEGKEKLNKIMINSTKNLGVFT